MASSMDARVDPLVPAGVDETGIPDGLGIGLGHLGQARDVGRAGPGELAERRELEIAGQGRRWLALLLD